MIPASYGLSAGIGAPQSKWENKVIDVTWSNRLGLTLTPITTGVWAAERPFLWNGIDVGGRMVVCRMGDGTLLVHSPVDLDDSLRESLEVGRSEEASDTRGLPQLRAPTRGHVFFFHLASTSLSTGG